VAKVGAAAMLLFARLNPDTPGKLVVHAYSYEHLEFAAHEVVALAAEGAGDPETAAISRSIAAEEQAMGERLAGVFDEAVDASLREVAPEDLAEQVTKYLGDAYALETQALRLLEGGKALAGVQSLTRVFAEHRQESERQRDRVGQRLSALGSAPNAIKNTALGLGGLNWGVVFGAQPDTPAKLAGFAFAFEHLEIAAYELLSRVAERAGDPETATLAREIADEERAAAAKVRATFPDAVDASVD
jgi:ferritin-like metal-binding protein YciE